MLRRNKQIDGLTAAYGRRQKGAIRIRRWSYFALKALGTRPGSKRPDFVEFYPAIRSVQEFADLSARVSCCLGDLGVPLYLPGPRFALDPTQVPYMDPSLVRDPGWVAHKPDGRRLLIVHRTSPAGILRIATHWGAGAVNTDLTMYERSELQYWTIREKIADASYPSPRESVDRLLNRFANSRSAFVLATGPSARAVELSEDIADIRIACNSIVQDEELLDNFRPNIIAFSDPVFHFGPSKYAAQFRRDLVRAAEDLDALIACGSDWVGPLLGMHPQLEPRLCVLYHKKGGSWRWPTADELTIRSSVSVLPNLMLPIAFLLSDQVSVAGVDGRQPGENYFWKHGTQYSDDLMRTVFDAHIAFFRDREYEDYYDEYCRHLEEFIQTAESHGKTIRGASPSWIPAFRKRGSSEPQTCE